MEQIIECKLYGYSQFFSFLNTSSDLANLDWLAHTSGKSAVLVEIRFIWPKVYHIKLKNISLKIFEIKFSKNHCS